MFMCVMLNLLILVMLDIKSYIEVKTNCSLADLLN